jgi:uncharacterized protein
VRAPRLSLAIAHQEVEVLSVENIESERPRFICEVRHSSQRSAFRGFNRAQAAVVEAAILVSRLHMLPAEKVDAEMAYLQIAIDKTAGDAEREAWGWLQAKIQSFRAEGIKK